MKFRRDLNLRSTLRHPMLGISFLNSFPYAPQPQAVLGAIPNESKKDNQSYHKHGVPKGSSTVLYQLTLP